MSAVAFRLFLAFVLLLAFRLQAFAFECANGANTDTETHCKFIITFVKPGSRAPDARIEQRLPPRKAGDPDTRSYALVVIVDRYPKFIKPADRDVVSVKNDLPNILRFLDEQKFDEVILLHNEDATVANIDYFLHEYLLPQFQAFGVRTRFLFAFDGHGAPAADPSLAGYMALSNSYGDGDYDSAHSYALSLLKIRLEELATYAHQSVALLASCFSGGVFPTNVTSGEQFSNTGQPGAHALTAAKADQLAWAHPGGKGTIFFDQLIAAVGDTHPDQGSTVITGPNGNGVRFNNEIVRLGKVLTTINDELDNEINPATGEKYPLILIGALAPKKQYEGVFFFLAPEDPRTISTSYFNGGGEPIKGQETISEETKTTGSAVVNHPELKVFKSPDTYKIRGVDVQQFLEVDFKQLAADDIRFAYLKSTDGASRLDPTFETNLRSALSVGMKVGAYHFFDTCDSAAAQFENIRQHVPNDPNLMPIAVDVEWETTLPGLPQRPGHRCNDVSSVKGRLLQLIQMLERYYKKVPVIYTIANFLKDFPIIDDDFDRYPLWIADFAKRARLNGPTLPGSNPWTIWQVRSDAELPGLNGVVDLDVFFGSDAQFEAFVAGQYNVGLIASLQSDLYNNNIAKINKRLEIYKQQIKQANMNTKVDLTPPIQLSPIQEPLPAPLTSGRPKCPGPKCPSATMNKPPKDQ